MANLDGFDEYVEKSMQDWHIAGSAIAIIKGGQVIHCKGYGLRNLQEKLPVDSDTLFAIGSSSKAFTTLGIGILVDRGLLEWDKPVRDYLPEFKMYDPFASERMTVRDLVCHRSGLPRYDLVWYGREGSRMDIIRRLPYLPPSKDFRTYFQYQNLMFITAGYLIERASGLSWEEFTQKEILTPLGMARSIFSVETMKVIENASRAHAVVKKKIVEIPYRNIDTVGPAGSINSNITEMCKWIQLHLNKGTFNGKRIISEANIEACHTPVMAINHNFFGDIDRYPEYHSGSYGLGWFVSHYHGHKFIHHGGGIDGFGTMVSFLPDDDIGMVVFANRTGLRYVFEQTFTAYDKLLGLEEVPWHARFMGMIKEEQAAAKKGQREHAARRVKDTQPSRPLEAYEGVYEHPGFGKLAIQKSEKGLQACLDSVTLDLTHYHYDSFEVSLEGVPLVCSFHLDPLGNVTDFTAPFEPSVPPIVFTRLAPAVEPETLSRYEGDYLLGERILNVRLHGDHLVIYIPGQPEHTLEFYQGTTFKAPDAPSLSVTFVIEKGSVTKVDLSIMGAIFLAEKIRK